eukprot:TRINITY_DN4627_c0_g1_i1.p1 TRINITY_DN4627_c0_g1~~TRINITY_DN4627_c0_g1_i1.p1  ORF type:complete len:599 (-),score=174.53 TRINITY_DN4627_c0_g1_i1:179-1975(-)
MELPVIGVPHVKDKDDIKFMIYGDIGIMNEKYSVADICFICDITGSMQYHIKVIRELLIDFTRNIQGIVNSQPRIAFVGFRDKEEEKKGKQIECVDFTAKPEQIVEYLKKVKCFGGGDTCEDLVTPLTRALSLDWRSDLNYVYLLLDAPAHGKSYHKEEISDYYSNDDEEKLLEKLAVHYRKSRINLVVLKCNENVDMMIEIFKKYYESQINKMSVIEMKRDECLKENFAKEFLITITKDISDTLSNSRYKNFRRVKHKCYNSDPVDENNEMDFPKTFTGKLHTGSITGLSLEDRKYNYKFGLKAEADFNCRVSARRIGTGTFTKCYPLHVGDDTNYVAKFNKSSPLKPDELKSDIEATLIAKYFADKFNNSLKKAAEAKGEPSVPKAINVLPLVILEKTSSDPFPKDKVFLAQKLLDGEFLKFNNNYGWIRKGGESMFLLAQTFSHFTYELSLGTMMVVDVQGIINDKKGLSITDPAVHSFLHKGRFGEANHGKLGMVRFFKTHECNAYCKLLELTDQKKVDKAELSKIKEKHKGEKGLDYLYKEFDIDVKVWKERIKGFNPAVAPTEAKIEEEVEEENEDEERTGVDEIKRCGGCK